MFDRTTQPHTESGGENLSELPQAEHNNLVALFNAGRYAELEDRTRLLIEQYQNSGFAWMALGASLQFQDKDALPALQKAAVLLPDNAEVHSNLGAAQQSLGHLDNAMASCHRALEIKPDFAEAHYNLGNTLKDLGQLEKAVVSYRRALEIKPDYAEAHSNLGAALKNLGQLDDAVASCHRAIDIKPDFADAYGNLGGALRAQGNLDGALASFQEQIKLAPNNSVAQHHVASLTGNNTERAPVQYVEKLFDDYADKFDIHLQKILQYEAPNKLVALVTQHLRLTEKKWNVLDLGCGTGLVGLEIAPFAGELVGVDLSVNMLEKAKTRNLYKRLEHSDLLTMMRGEKTSSYEVIIAADVFIYLGKLDEVVSEIKRLLYPNGVLAFSIESLLAIPTFGSGMDMPHDYQLENTGRYSHSTDYISRLAATNGFLIQEMAEIQIRIEQGKPINGYLALWKS